MHFQENSFKVYCIDGKPTSQHKTKLLNEAFRLRFQVFSQELGWVPASSIVEGREKDQYDNNAIHFIVVTANDSMVVAYARLIPPGNTFMITESFRELVKDEDIRILEALKDNSAEISRLLVRKGFRGRKDGLSLNMLLFRAMYQWATIKHSLRYWYAVVTPGLYSLLNHYFSCTVIGTPHKLNGDKINSIALRIDLEICKKNFAKERPELLRWFLNRAGP